jgi:hypothetical protein
VATPHLKSGPKSNREKSIFCRKGIFPKTKLGDMAAPTEEAKNKRKTFRRSIGRILS